MKLQELECALKEQLASLKPVSVIPSNAEEGALLTMPKPENTDCFRKLTPFFNVFLDDVFQSSHYGTEVYLK